MRAGTDSRDAGTLLANPLTIAPMYVAAYAVGCFLLGVPPQGVAFEMSWTWLTTALAPIWRPLLLGCLVLGLSAATVGYLLLGGMWRLSLVLKYRERKTGATPKDSANGEK